MPTIVHDYKTYIQLRQTTKDVVPWVCTMINALSGVDDVDFGIIRMIDSEMDFYYCHTNNGYVQVTDIKEGLCHNLSEHIIRPHDIQWWNQVLYDRNGTILYDEVYNSLPIGNSNERTFGELIMSAKEEVSRWGVSIPAKLYVVDSIYSNPLLRYVLQCNGAESISILSPTSLADEYTPCALRQESLIPDVIFSTRPNFSIKELIGDGLDITIPLNNIGDSVMFNKYSWNDIVINDSYDYLVGNLKMKRIHLSIDVDPFGIVFLDIRDHQEFKSLPIYSAFI